MTARTISDKANQVNRGTKLIVDFYKTPLVRSLRRLIAKGDTLDVISKEVFNSEVSPQAIHQNYLKKGAAK
jgi:hypothetical protein